MAENNIVLFENDVWTITDIGRRQSLMIDNHNSSHLSWHIDYPIMYDNETVAYDNPFLVPQYIKDKVKVNLRKKLQKLGDVS